VNRRAMPSDGRAVRAPIVSTGLLPVLLLSLAACGSPSSAAASAATVPDPNGVPPAELCSFLQSTLPSLKDSPSQYAAMLTESSQISQFYQSRNALQAMGGVDFDATTKKACPAVRKSVLEATGQKTLNSLRASS
jgi:hypothetical protein